MVHDTPARQKARALKEEIRSLSREAKALEEMGGMEAEVTARHDRAGELSREADKLKEAARLEDLSVRREHLVKQTKKGGIRTYYRWVASWRDGDKTCKVYLGSCKKNEPGRGAAEGKETKSGRTWDRRVI